MTEIEAADSLTFRVYHYLFQLDFDTYQTFNFTLNYFYLNFFSLPIFPNPTIPLTQPIAPSAKKS